MPPLDPIPAALLGALAVTILVLLLAVVFGDSSDEDECGPKCGTHGHDMAIVSEKTVLESVDWEYVYDAEQVDECEDDAGNTVVRNRVPVRGELVFDGRVVVTESVKECRFCDRSRTFRDVEWWLPGESTPNDAPVESMEDYLHEHAAERGTRYTGICLRRA